MRYVIVLICGVLMISCGDEKKAAPVKAAEAPKTVLVDVKDESNRFPKTDRVEVRVEAVLMGKSFLGAGNLAHYKQGMQEYDLFLARSTGGEAAALVLFDYKKTLANPKLIPRFGGYFGQDGNKDVFVFSKGPWIAGVSGLPEKDADRVARDFAARLTF